MPYVPPELKERIKREVSIQRLAEARGIKLRRSGKELIGLCPFHKDTNPSLNIDPVKNVWNCKGACGEGGDVILWVMRAEGVSFKHAVELLKRDYLPSSSSAGPPPKICTVPKLPAPVERTADDRKVLLQVVSYYQETLKQSPEALKYLEGRGLKSAEMIGEFRMGFANRTLGYRLPDSNRIAGAELRGRLQKLGIYRESGHEHFNGSVVIPIFDSEGNVVQMYGRKITANLRAGTPDHLYLPGPHRGVWNEAALIASKEIILCEALIDALTFWCAGFRHVTTSYGVNGFTEEIKAAFRRHGTKKIYIAYDRDEAGERAAQEHAAQLIEMGIECFRVEFPKGMDANEAALKTSPASKVLGLHLNSAAWLGKGKRPSIAVIEPAKIEPAVQTPAPQIETPKPEPQIEEASQPEPQVEMKSDEPTPTPTAEEKSEPAAKEENAISLPTPEITAENVLPLAVEQEAAPAVLPPSMVLSGTTAPYMQVELRGEEIILTEGDRRYRVRGLGKNMSYELLRVNVLASRTTMRGEGFHVDTLDLYSARQRMVFAKQAAEELGIKEEVIKRDLGHVLVKLETLQDEQIKKAMEAPEPGVEMTAEDRAAAMALLSDPRLLDRILEDFARCGVVGEETNKKVSYLAAVSRLLPAPLAVVVQSSSAAGKSSLLESLLDFLPEEQRVEYSAMTGQALFYMGEHDLKNKVLAVVEEEGAQRAAYALKLLQSEGVLTIASTGKDPNNGRLITHQYRVEGPVMIFLTTTALDVDEELLNRCIVLTVNEDKEQTKAIHRKQREAQTLDGLWARQQRADILRLHRNAQRLLRPIAVVNEHARELTFPDSMTRTRRDHMKFLTLINAIALLHQYQRPLQTDVRQGKTLEYIEATEDDVKLAWQLVSEVLVRSLDELSPQTQRLLVLIDEMVTRACEEQKIERTEYRFSRRDVREYLGCGDTQLRKHLNRLEELEYLVVHRGGRGQTFVYELVLGLVDVEKLKQNLAGVKGHFAGSTPPQSRGSAWDAPGAESPATTRANGDLAENPRKNTTRESESENAVAVVRKVK